MAYLLLGLALLGGLLLILKWFVEADPKALTTALTWLAIVGLVAVTVFLAVTGRLGWAIGSAMVLMPMAARLYRAQRTMKNYARAAGIGSSGRTTNLETRYLRMVLDHDSGAMDGEVREGPFVGRRLNDLSARQLLQLLEVVSASDAESERVLEAYLDRAHPDWRSGMHAEHDDGDSGNDRRASSETVTMNREEAYDVLGLAPGAGDADIKAAHQRLIASLHPDKGGSNYLAAKINQARQVLLGR